MLSRKERATTYSERCKSIARHIQEDHENYIVTECTYHFDNPCFIILNNFNWNRYHCLYSNYSILWLPISKTQSCDLPELYFDLIELYHLLGVNYVLPYSGVFRESSGYTIGMFQMNIYLYPPKIITQAVFKETVYAFIIFFCAVSHRLGGSVPNMKLFSFMYTHNHPVLCDIGSLNVENRERLRFRNGHFNKKKWSRVMRHKTTRDILRYAKIYFTHFFQKKKKNRQCILKEGFDDETHNLICKSGRKSLFQVITEYKHLMPDRNIDPVIHKWKKDLNG